MWCWKSQKHIFRGFLKRSCSSLVQDTLITLMSFFEVKCPENVSKCPDWDIFGTFRDIFGTFSHIFAHCEQGSSSNWEWSRRLLAWVVSSGETLSQTAFHLPSLLKQSCPVAIQDLWKQVSQYNTMRVRVNSFFLPFKCFKEKNYEWNFFFKYYLILQLKVKPCGPIFDQ